MFTPFRTLWLLSLFAIALEYASGECFSLASSCGPSSSPPRPLKRITHPTTHALEILPRRPSPSGFYAKRSLLISSSVLEHTDTFRLTISAFDQTFYLHLRPNEHLVHPAARITYHTTTSDGRRVTHTEPLLRQNVKAYWGEVVNPDVSQARLREDAAGVHPRPSGRKDELGWARITVYDQGDIDAGRSPSFEGAFSVNGDVHHVLTTANYVRNKHALDPHVLLEAHPDAGLVVFRDSDVMRVEEYVGGAATPGRTCAHDRMDWNVNPLANPILRKPPLASPWYDPLGILYPQTRGNHSLARRDDVAGGNMGSNFEGNIGQTAGCPTTQKVIYMGAAADCEYTSTYGSTQNATQQIITNFNTASALYKSTFNVSLGLVELQVQDPTCPATTDPSNPWNIPCSGNATLNDRLSLFSAWRGQKGNDSAGLWHLMSGCPTGTEVGIAWLGTLCQQSASGDPGSVVSGTAVTTAGKIEWQVLAHEIGHNFGAIHDCTDGCGTSGSPVCCPLSADSCNANSQFIMNPVADTGEMKFSPCSLGNIYTSDATRTISLGMCGNGIVEQGEQCDPGLGVNSTCCDSSTCKFTANAQCDPASSACCTDTCTFAPSTQVCRPAKDPNCDQPEMCTGNSSTCPADNFSPNGQSCGSGGLACASGTIGASMNLQKACPSQDDKSCQVTCQDPSTSNQCVVLQSQLIDGSPCGYGGTCTQGTCKAGSALDTAKAWYRDNLQIAIPVTVVGGLLILLIIWFICSRVYRCTRRRPRGSSFEPGLRGKPGQRLDSSMGSYAVPVMTQAPGNGAYISPQYPSTTHTRGRSDGWAVPPTPSAPQHKPTRSAGSNDYLSRYSS
ncbi:uncharacterized protein PHACADRAFT_179757 [Phanerochaete carnosa HHB-10118-sp]|uniref:Disintegrin and metalloproteinase domain-containing protein B n=1 Tax=Phanerochaete carnosa (strain HHB-10118-sp) TaxID=650164 RepID=K5W979_PHACS|nr:uncharacterized protein PHACADRAFT_179757 [Phanerochaete carnosa HHB-10118-sp]EKM60498.1 hypothetical protein PHACADRAFT_179757 [Phanerochaete carnosa HHB-10118-sp]